MDRRDPRRRLLILAVVFAACRSGPPPGVTEIRLWAMGREGEVVQQMLPAFEREHPDIRVRVQQIPWSAAHEKLLTAYVGGAMPDVFQAGNTWLPELHAVGALAPLDASIDGAGIARDDYFPGILDTNVIDGTTWALPWYVDTRLLFYRSDVLKAAGYTEVPRTWTGWREAMERIAQRAGPGNHAILLPLREWQVPVILALQHGATLLRDDGRRGDFESAACRRAFEFYVDLFRSGLAPRAGDSALANLYEDFARGYFAFVVTGPWNIGEFARRLPAATPWETAPLPAPDGEWPGVSLAGGASLALSSASAHKAAAWAVVEYLASPARQLEFHRLTGDLPARRSAWLDAALPTEPHARAFWLQLQYTRSTPKIPEWERITSKIMRYGEAAIRGDLALDEALAALDHDVDAVLEKRRWLLDARR